MPGMSGLELQQRLNLRGAVIPVIFITGHGDVPMAVEAMQQGAFDFLQKPFRDQDLMDRIQRALERDRANRAELGERSRIREQHETLTPREREVLALVTERKGHKVMAADLGLSRRTIEIHRARVMEKMALPPSLSWCGWYWTSSKATGKTLPSPALPPERLNRRAGLPLRL